MYEILIVVYLIIAIALVGLILIQQGKGADMGASFGAGASATLFGSSGSGNFLTKTTTFLATAFFILSIFLGSMTANSVKQEDEFSDLSVPTETAPAAQSELPSEIPVGDAPKTDGSDEVPVN
ncbi:preprotein translocase subunit SecG [Psychrosphaera aestuarii]|jgi:preprotein translocase subunit SecG|uniref:preprotein translocase subunit SecG n=1 Tax=Psychrosphaera aestuarii TaxID=1266052 RepID=UPI001B31B46D|nr:preprotein translocase subunit SecG [Psychrosphaera aestuarii]